MVRVALITPMKRGLKENRNSSSQSENGSCTNYPDEKGTERAGLLFTYRRENIGCTNYPDEKGTESIRSLT